MFRRNPTNQSPQRNNSDWNVRENPDACYECGRTGHIKKYCPQLRNKTANSNSRDFKEKKFKSRKALLTWDDSDESDKEGSEDEDVAQLCFMANDDDPKITPEKHFNELKSAFLELSKNYEKLKIKNADLKNKAFSLISTVEELEELKNISEALNDSEWILAMQDELNQFERSDVCTLVPAPVQQKWDHKTAKVDFNVDLTHKLCAALMLPPFRGTGSPLSLIIGSLCIKHPNLFGRSEKLDVLCNKGLYDSNVLIAYRKPRPEWLAQQSFLIQHSISPEVGVHGLPVDNFSRSGSSGVNLCRFSAVVDLNEPASSNWSSNTSIKFEHVRPVDDEGRSISRDLHGFPVTCSGGYHDSMVVVKQESRFAKINDRSFTRFSLQIEQGIPFLSKWLIFNRFKFVASKAVALGPAVLLTSLTGGSVVGEIAPYQAFAIGGLGSVRGYGEGAVGSGRSCLVANSELTFPLNQMLEGAIFLDCGTDLGSGRYVPGNPALRHGKPGTGVGLGCGLRFKTQLGHFQVDYALNAFRQKTTFRRTLAWYLEKLLPLEPTLISPIKIPESG
ncbi:hypothetical protein RJ640_017499 [Escallonia rubra]|uniref:CCHC-type domain-containing protein n=1 Tax=Escallonia rubra TaxID=112253 RepID=A0AA88UCW9_9ASTE|nr:hypothetical protein RJ640_017499 [Escallonia rubra]